jgi:hypothetical protein
MDFLKFVQEKSDEKRTHGDVETADRLLNAIREHRKGRKDA